MPYISKSSLQKSCSRCSRKILCKFQLKEVGSQDSVRTPNSVKKPNSSKLHSSKRHGNTSEHTSEFKKILAFLRRHGVGRQLAPVRTLGQYRRDAEILDKEIACIHCISQDDRATPFERGPVMAITCR
jgi:hypothetical protein